MAAPKTATATASRFELCEDCHPEEVEGYLRTGMARSLQATEGALIIEDFSRATVRHPLMGATYRAYVDKRGVWWQEESLAGSSYRRAVKVEYIIGSGNHTRSYLGRINGQLSQMPLTWYAGRGIWDLSPGYDGAGHYRFMRTVSPECLFCHNSLAKHQAETDAVYEEPLPHGIGCERCHGDPAEHIKLRHAGKGPVSGAPDTSILNPARMSPRRAQQVCAQCHLQGVVRLLQPGARWDTYSPDIDLGDHLTAFGLTGPEEGFGIASHGERLSLSQCVKQSSKALRCVTCHNPHQPDSERAAIQSCKGCHTPILAKSCGGTKAAANCASCHMRKGPTSDIPHVRFTDHFIRRRPSTTKPEGPPPTGLRKLLPPAPGIKEDVSPIRDAVAMVQAAIRAAKHPGLLGPGLEALGQALARAPRSYVGWESMALGSLQAGRPQVALGAFRKALTLKPDAVLIIEHYANTALQLGFIEEAIKILRKAVSLRPEFGVGWGLLAQALDRGGNSELATRAFERAVKLLPDDGSLLGHFVVHLERNGQRSAAASLLAKAYSVDPFNHRNAVKLAEYRLSSGDAVSTVEIMTTALSLDSELVYALVVRARAYAGLGWGDLAASDLDAAIAKAPKAAALYLERARLAEATGNPGEARAYREKAKALQK